MRNTWNYKLAQERMAEKNLSRAEVAKKLKMEIKSFGHTMRGRKPNTQTIILLSQILDCTEEELLSPSDHGQVAS